MERPLDLSGRLMLPFWGLIIMLALYLLARRLPHHKES